MNESCCNVNVSAQAGAQACAPTSAPTSARATLAPAVDIVESADALTVYADLPGVPQDGLTVSLEDQVLTIEGTPRVESFAGYTAALRELDDVAYARSFRLSEHIDRAGIQATLRNGVLTLTLPKAKPQSRKIEIQVS